MLKINECPAFLFLFLALCLTGFSQALAPTPIREELETVIVEEIKISVSAFDESGEFASDVRKEDLVISEDERLQQASSLRRAPANVLIVIDTGGAMRSNLSQTRRAAKNLVESLQGSARISIFQFGDKVEMLADWTTDRVEILDVLDKKLSFGRRSALNDALKKAVEFFYKTPLENRHLVIIAGGTDGFNDAAVRDAAKRSLMASDISVHVVSYTNLQKESVAQASPIFIKGEQKPRRLPEEIVESLPDPKGAYEKRNATIRDVARAPRLGSITLDVKRIKRANKDKNELEAGEQFLAQIAENANGEIFLPKTASELIEKTAAIAKIIDSQYVLTYVPKRALNGSPPGEIRRIEVSSKRAGLQIDARRKFVVGTKK